MNFNDALSYLSNSQWFGSRLGLERMNELLSRLGNPHHKLKFIHIAGTNGKGSTSAMLAEVLLAAGYRTGLYTSPYIQKFNERIQVDGVPICNDDLVSVTLEMQKHADEMDDHPTIFEMITAIAFLHFLRSGCNIVVLEVGLGGRLDATNVIPAPEVAVITSIGLDHTAELGDTLELIASEKAGIIKDNSRVVLYPQVESVDTVISDICAERNAVLHRVGTDIILRSSTLDGQRFDYAGMCDLRIPLLGEHQLMNAATAIQTVFALRNVGWDIGDNDLRERLEQTNWPARFEVVHQNPTVILDGGHNKQCVDAIAAALTQYFPHQQVIFLLGVMADKAYDTMFDALLPLVGHIVTVTPSNERALPAGELAGLFIQKKVGTVTACENVRKGMAIALQLAGEAGVICACGSLYMAGEIRDYFGM